MSFFTLLLIAGIVFFFLKKSSDKKQVESGQNDSQIQVLRSYYARVRERANDLGAGVICVGTYFFTVDGSVDTSSAYMSVMVQDGTNDALAKSMGMDVSIMGGKTYYQYVLKAPFSRAKKKAILHRLAPMLKADFPNDVFNIDDSIPSLFAMVDVQDAMDLLNYTR